MRFKLLLVLLATGIANLPAQTRSWTPPASARELPPARSEAEKRILSVIDQARHQGEVYLEVPVPDGRLLRVMAESVQAKRAVEVGTSTGYSGLWLSLALQATGGKLTTFEIDAGRAAQARRHFQQAGVDSLITIVQGDAHANVKKVQGPLDLVFIDADKSGYVDYLKTLLPLIRPGGVILAHNIDMVPDYVRWVTTDPQLETIFSTEGGGMGITIKKH